VKRFTALAVGTEPTSALKDELGHAIQPLESIFAGEPAEELAVIRDLRAAQAALRRKEDFR
jgi:hypothetical protein